MDQICSIFYLLKGAVFFIFHSHDLTNSVVYKGDMSNVGNLGGQHYKALLNAANNKTLEKR